MRALSLFLTISLAAVCLIGCTKDFGTINTDPNTPTVVTADLLLTPILRSTVQGQFNYDNGAALSRHVSRTNYNEVEQYSLGSNQGAWTSSYTRLNNIQEMIKVAERDNKSSAKAVGYILKAFTISTLTDLWGDVPYFEACQGSDLVTPSYDTQKDIYTAEGGIISLLKEAERLLSDAGVDPLPSDIMYAGNITKWRKLGNSLRLRYLMRISNRTSEITTYDIVREIAETVQLPLLETNSDNALLPYLPNNPNQCPIFSMRAGSLEYIRMSKESDERLNLINDPRRTIWFARTTNSSANQPLYLGLPSGCSSTTLENMGYSSPDVSLLGDYYSASPDGCSAVLMNCSEVMFLIAEAIIKGYADGNAAEWYHKGIVASFDYYCKTAPDADYLSQPEVAFDAGKGLQQIMTQKWIAQIFVGYEAWFDFKRTGYPEMEPLIDNRNPTRPGEIPSRFYYPEDEQTLNTANYGLSISRQAGGRDDINTKLWWEK